MRLLLLLFPGLATAGPTLALTVSHETAPPGATAQIKLSTATPQIVASGEISLNLDPNFFGSPTSIVPLGAAGDGSGYASVSAGHVDIHFYNVGGIAQRPILAITVPLLPSVKIGTAAAITADPSGSVWTDPTGNSYAVTITGGAVTAGGSLSVQNVSPSGGLLRAGSVLRIFGTGFDSSTVIDIPALAIASVQAAAPQELDVRLAAPADIGGKQITVRGPDGSEVDFFGSVAAPPLGTSPSGRFDGTLPLFPTLSYQAGAAHTTQYNSGWFALANPGTEPVAAELYPTMGGPVSYTQQFTVPAGGVYYTSIQPDAYLVVLAAAPLQMLELQQYCGFQASSCTQSIGAMIPMGIPTLQAELNNNAAQFEWQTGTPAPSIQQTTVVFSEPTAYTVSTSTTDGATWLSAAATSAASSLQAIVNVTVNPASLNPGYYHGTVTVTPAADAIHPNVVAATIPVALTVLASSSAGVTPALLVTPTVLCLGPVPMSCPPSSGQIVVQTANVPAPVTVRATTSDGGNWLSVSTTSLDTPAYITPSVDQSHLAPGTYHADLEVSVPGQTTDVPVILTVPGAWYDPTQFDTSVFSNGFVPVAGSLLNGASATQGAIAPGEIITFHGVNLNAQVLIDGKPVPLLYSSSSQINAIVPFETADETIATIQLSGEGNTTTWSVPVASAAPGIFTADSSGGGQAAVLNSDNSVNGASQPAVRGSEIQIFATGIPYSGQVTGGITPRRRRARVPL